MVVKYPNFDGTQACATEDAELFFPEGGSKEAYAAKRKAIQICQSCKFTETCLDYALRTDVKGIWAGTDERERQRIRRERGIKDVEYMYLSIDRLTR